MFSRSRNGCDLVLNQLWNLFQEWQRQRSADEVTTRSHQQALSEADDEREESRRHKQIERLYWRKQAAIAKWQLNIARRMSWFSYISSLAAIASILGLMATVVLTGMQVKLSREQNAQAFKTMRMDQRAWIEIAPVRIKEKRLELVPGQMLSIDIKMLNIGKTVARKIIVQTKVEKLNPSQSPSIDDEKWIFGEKTIVGVLYPNDEREPTQTHLLELDQSNNTFVAAIISQVDLQDWNDGKFYIAVHGRVDYVDIFNVSHWSTYCGAFTGKEHFGGTPTLACSQYYNGTDSNDE